MQCIENEQISATTQLNDSSLEWKISCLVIDGTGSKEQKHL